MLTFNAIDVETANANRASICQIGTVHVRDGQIQDQWETLVNPEEWFDPHNTHIHGIEATAVEDSPTLPEIRGELRRRLRGSVLVSHTPFDRIAFERAMEKYGLEQLQVTWLDSARIARRAWPDKYAVRGYALKNIAKDLGISFRHHNALEDARVSAEVTLHACAESGLDINDWLQRVGQPIHSSASKSGYRSRSGQSVRREGNTEGLLYGETIVFTGSLSISRQSAADLAANAGCNVGTSVTQQTTMLVIGIQDKSKFNGYDKSSKHRKTELLVSQGKEIQILSEADFCEIARIKI